MIIKEENLEAFPIQFKEINYSDFPGYNRIDEEKIIVTPNEEGFISEKLRDNVDLFNNDTTIINAGVGQGKTTAIIEFIKHYYEKTVDESANYKIIVVTPFKALNSKYEIDISKAIGIDGLCFDYETLSLNINHDFQEYFKHPIQLISVKSILGDAGQDALEQSAVKTKYYKYLREQCTANNQKVIMFFDELHESLETFKEQYIPNLFNWKEVTHKIIVSSATFSESSITVLKYFAEITDKNIKIIESTRTKSLDQSSLSLYFYKSNKYNIKDHYFQYIFDELIIAKDYSVLNILCPTKKLAEEIYNSEIGERLKQRFLDLNICIGGVDSKSFDAEKSNIGTTFKTGVSITEKNSCYVVILPYSTVYTMSTKSVFTDKINSLTQALARPRVKAEIIVIAPFPTKLIIRPSDTKEYITKLSFREFRFENKDNQAEFLNYHEQKNLVLQKFEEIKLRQNSGIKHLETVEDGLQIDPDTFDWFRLKSGDKYLHKTFEAYGKTLANYLYWAAWNNQFVNCKLKAIVTKIPMYFAKGEIQKGLDRNIPNEIINQGSFADFSDKELYDKVRNYIYQHDVILTTTTVELDGIPITRRVKIKPSLNPTFEKQIYHFIQRSKTPYFKEDYDNPIDDLAFTKEKYIRIAISQCLTNIESSKTLSEEEHLLIANYTNLYAFKDILINEYSILSQGGEKLLPIDSHFAFKTNHLIRLKVIFENLKKEEVGFDLFNNKTLLTEKAIYSTLKKVFFKVSQTVHSQKKYEKVNEEHSFEYSEYKLNLIYNTAMPYLYFPIPPNIYVKNYLADEDEELEIEAIDLREIDQDEFNRTAE